MYTYGRKCNSFKILLKLFHCNAHKECNNIYYYLKTVAINILFYTLHGRINYYSLVSLITLY